MKGYFVAKDSFVAEVTFNALTLIWVSSVGVPIETWNLVRK